MNIRRQHRFNSPSSNIHRMSAANFHDRAWAGRMGMDKFDQRLNRFAIGQLILQYLNPPLISANSARNHRLVSE